MMILLSIMISRYMAPSIISSQKTVEQTAAIQEVILPEVTF